METTRTSLLLAMIAICIAGYEASHHPLSKIEKYLEDTVPNKDYEENLQASLNLLETKKRENRIKYSTTADLLEDIAFINELVVDKNCSDQSVSLLRSKMNAYGRPIYLNGGGMGRRLDVVFRGLKRKHKEICQEVLENQVTEEYSKLTPAQVDSVNEFMSHIREPNDPISLVSVDPISMEKLLDAAFYRHIIKMLQNKTGSKNLEDLKSAFVLHIINPCEYVTEATRIALQNYFEFNKYSKLDDYLMGPRGPEPSLEFSKLFVRLNVCRYISIWDSRALAAMADELRNLESLDMFRP